MKRIRIAFLGLISAILFLADPAAQGCRADEPTADIVEKLAQKFLENLGASKVDVLVRSVSLPWYNGGQIEESEEALKTTLTTMVKWYDEHEGATRWKILAIGKYKDLKDKESSQLGPKDRKKMDAFLAADDWLVIVGKVVDGDVRPSLYLLAKHRKGKLGIVGAHK
ncbi:MAG TPA: hypothetical protein VKS79_07555 [Gemmataceae bacterium]|nr:hypothetical protein [Gemmataceae bacterium]